MCELNNQNWEIKTPQYKILRTTACASTVVAASQGVQLSADDNQGTAPAQAVVGNKNKKTKTMKKIIYLLFTVCLLGCQENTPKNKPVQMPQEDIITESRDSAIVAKPNTVLNTKTDTISKQAKPANPKKIQKPPTKKIPQKIAPPQKQTLGNDLLVGGGKYRYCSSSACLYYSISVTPKNTQIKFHTAYCEGKKILLDGFSSVDGYNRSYTITIGLPWNSGINMGMKGKCEFPDGKAPIPYSGKMLIEYELNGLIKYQNIPATDFKKHLDDKDRGC